MQQCIIKTFQELTPDELYDILHLRNIVFIVEQNCPFKELDYIDQHCHHLYFKEADKLIAYTRLLPQGVMYPELSIGRVVTHPHYRGSGLGRELMRTSIHEIRRIHGNHSIRIGAQLYLKKFYEAFGFFEQGEIYLEDGIQHVQMLLQPG